tara:strand:+ start:54 stop:248 length:195 start_codon:yes stop_codon:yes gene_type:complete
MALSQTTQESINEAEGNIRNALHHASRNERPYIVKELAAILWSLSKLEGCDSVLDTLDEIRIEE